MGLWKGSKESLDSYMSKLQNVEKSKYYPEWGGGGSTSPKQSEAELATLLSNPMGREYMEKALNEGKGEVALDNLKNIEAIGEYFNEALEKLDDEGIELNDEQKVGLAELIKEADAGVKSVSQNSYGHIEIEFEKKAGTYLIFTDYEDAEAHGIELIKNQIEDFGKEVPEIRRALANNLSRSGESYFYEGMRESLTSYVDDIESEKSSDPDFENRLEEEMATAGCETKEDYVDHLCNEYGSGYEYYLSNFGEMDTANLIIEKGLYDEDESAKDLLRIAGLGQTIASYDGNEQELSGDLYAYRTN